MSPRLGGTAATLVCRPWRTDDGGDHLLFLGEVVEVITTDRRPLLFHDSAFHHIGNPSSEVVWLGCQDDPSTGWFDATTSFTALDVPAIPRSTHY